MTAVYIASPLGFSAPGRAYSDQVLVPAVRAAGFEALDPWAAGDELFAGVDMTDLDALAAANAAVGAANAEMIERADLVLAVLDGIDVDSGTASEIGYAAATGATVVGLRTDFRLAGDNAASVVNLQVEHFIARSGGRIVSELDAAIEALVEVGSPH